MDTQQAINAISTQATPASGTSPSRRPYQAPQLIPLLQKETELISHIFGSVAS